MTREDVLQAEIIQLRERIEDKDFEIIDLRRQLGIKATSRMVDALVLKGLTNQQAEIMALCYEGRGQFVSNRVLEERVTPVWSDDRDIAFIRVQIHRIRKKIGADVISTQWGRGYCITTKGIDFCERALAEMENRL